MFSVHSLQEGETAIFFAARNGHVDIVKLLAESGALVDHKNKVYPHHFQISGSTSCKCSVLPLEL